MSEVELILAKLKIVSEEQEKGMYLCDKEHSKMLLDYITNLQKKISGLETENDKLKEQCKQWKENHKAVCIQRDNILNNTVKDIEEQIDYKSRNEKAIDIAYEYSQIDGEHHKTWCIDQIVRALTGNNYNEFVKEYENNGEYKWNVGIAP